MATVTWDADRTRTLKILNGQSLSDVLDLRIDTQRSRYLLTVIDPATLPETVTVQVSHRPDGAFVALQRSGADVTLPAGKAVTISDLNVGALRLSSGTNVAADRVFLLLGTT